MKIVIIFLLSSCSISGIFAGVGEDIVAAEETGVQQRSTEDLTVTNSHLTLFLFTKDNPEIAFTISNADVDQLDESNFDPTKQILFVFHGWQSHGSSEMNEEIRSTLYPDHDVNLFNVDWSPVANRTYSQCISSHVNVGEIAGQFINEIQEKYSITGSQFLLLGHSLGAHIAGATGAAVNSKVATIIGFDPAGPYFDNKDTAERLDSTDATFVEVIHTSRAGIQTSIGHADYYPNGGKSQPGCGTLDISCSHYRSYDYYIESLTRGNVFQAVSCTSNLRYSLNLCASNAVSPMGLFSPDTTASGDYYLDTNSQAPFGQS